MNQKCFASVWVIAIVTCVACTGPVQAEMLDNTNVAYMKTTVSSTTVDTTRRLWSEGTRERVTRRPA